MLRKFGFLQFGAAVITGLCVAFPATAAERVPRWELGAGVASISFPDYRGARHTNVRTLPLPYAIYRGDTVQIKRDGFSLELFDSPRLEITLSAAASLPGDDEAENSPRVGMPELLPTFEAGPSLDYWLIRPQAAGWQARLRWPVRAVMATDLRQFESAGVLTQPQLDVSHRWTPGPWSIRLGGGFGVLWASEDYHDYFYEVDPQFVTPQRPAYDARAGYSGLRAGLQFSVVNGPWRLGMGLLADEFGDARFADSPLVETDTSLVAFFGLAYRFRQSREFVLREED